MTLSTDQLSNLELTEREINDRRLMIDTAIDVQVILQLLIEKGIVTREEVQKMRYRVSTNDSRYSLAKKWLDQAYDEVQRYKDDPTALLKEIMRSKLNK